MGEFIVLAICLSGNYIFCENENLLSTYIMVNYEFKVTEAGFTVPWPLG